MPSQDILPAIIKYVIRVATCIEEELNIPMETSSQVATASWPARLGDRNSAQLARRDCLTNRCIQVIHTLRDLVKSTTPGATAGKDSSPNTPTIMT
jgi:hypothetical protein